MTGYDGMCCDMLRYVVMGCARVGLQNAAPGSTIVYECQVSKVPPECNLVEQTWGIVGLGDLLALPASLSMCWHPTHRIL